MPTHTKNSNAVKQIRENLKKTDDGFVLDCSVQDTSYVSFVFDTLKDLGIPACIRTEAGVLSQEDIMHMQLARDLFQVFVKHYTKVQTYNSVVMASLKVQLDIKGGGGKHYSCGGSILSKYWVITAAHCCVDSVTFGLTTTYLVTHGALVKVIAGDSYKTDNEGTEQTVVVRQIFIHESFDNLILQNDIALLRLSTPLSLTNQVAGIAVGSTTPTSGSTVTVAGWGTLKSGELSKYLIQAVYGVPSMSQCKAAYTKDYPILPGMWCTGDYSMLKHSATGDSGGPIFIKTGSNFALYGIVSWGPDDDKVGPGQYDVNTDVSYYKDWISGIQASGYTQYMQTLLATPDSVTIDWSSKNDRYRYQNYHISSNHAYVQVEILTFEFLEKVDSVTLYDGPDVFSPLLFQLRYDTDFKGAGTNIYTSTSNSIFVLARTNGNFQTKSFSFKYRSVNVPGPGPEVYGCGTGYTLCASKNQCYHNIARCDNTTDCIDSSDELCSGSIQIYLYRQPYNLIFLILFFIYFIL